MSGAWIGLALALTSSSALQPWRELAPPAREATVQAMRQLPLRERMLEASQRFLETPYLYSALGEGEGQDPDPPLRYDAVDCLSLVEQSMALSLATDDASVEPLLDQIRYIQNRAYLDRNHLMEAQWLPSNVRKGFLEDVTERYGGEATVAASKVVTSTSWGSPSSQALKLTPDRRPVGEFPVRFLPLERVMPRADRIPGGTLLLVVRQDLPNKVTRITHLGIVVHKGKRVFLRHASKSPYNRVVDEPLADFLTRNARYAKWKVNGVALYEVTEPPRAASGVGTR
jgi:hypothetical protein